jgi:outer membrane protein TolC
MALNLPREQWSRPILPTDVPHFDGTATPSVDEALATAIANRPEIAQLDADRQLSELQMRKAENDKLPQIDLSIGGTLYGQDATATGAIGEIGAHDFSGWFVGVNLVWTPLHRASDTAAKLARIQHEVRMTGHEQKVQAMWGEVRGAVRANRAAALQVVAASESRVLAADSLAIENKKFLAGASSNITIATVQERVAGAELAELQALIGNERAHTALLLATGKLLEARHVKLVAGR